jgi:hypothetical protein
VYLHARGSINPPVLPPLARKAAGAVVALQDVHADRRDFRKRSVMHMVGVNEIVVAVALVCAADALGSFVGVDISASSEAHPQWRRPVRTYFRRDTGGWTLVGLERPPERLTADRAT